MAIGARVVPGQHPAIQAIQQAGSALSDMGQLFNQIKQNKTYEKSVEYQHWNNAATKLFEAYDKMAEATDPGYAQEAFGGAFTELFVGGGMDRGVANEMMKRINASPLNYRYVLGRVYRESLLEEGGYDTSKAMKIVEDERKRALEAQAVPTTADGIQEPVAAENARQFKAVQGEPDQPMPRGMLGQTAEGEQAILQTPGTPPTADRPAVAPKPDIGTPGGPPVRMLSMTPQAAGEALMQFRSAKGDQKKAVLKTLFPSLKSAPPSIYQAAEMILMGRQKGDDRLVQSGIAIWAKAAVKEATP